MVVIALDELCSVVTDKRDTVHMAKVDEYRSIVDSSGLECKTFFPGFSYDDFDRNGCISAWKMSKCFEGGRAFAFQIEFLVDLIKMTTEKRNFIVAQHFQLEPNILRHKTCPFSVTMRLVHVGNSSLTFKQEFVNENDQSVIGTCDSKMVRVDGTTKRPIAHDETLRKKYSYMLGTNEPSKFLSKIPDLPLNSCNIPIFVLHSDTDKNQHLNQGQYLRYCLDCAATAAVEGKYKYFTKDICYYQALDIHVLYKKEALPGDLVHVHTWQDEITLQDLHFIITKDRNSIFYARIKYAVNPLANL